MKSIVLGVIISMSLLTGCANIAKETTTGAVLGGVLGAVVGHQSGHAGEGAVVGAAAGAIGGTIVGGQMEKKFCPNCGRRFSSSSEYCPYDGSELNIVDNKDN